ncbi:MAG: hypothetical protein RLZZ428_761 [Pseudomonadota bacterium]
MKWTKLSLVAALAVSSAVAGGDVVAPVVAAASQPATTIDGKLVGYYYSENSEGSLFGKDSSGISSAVTLNVSHKFTENITGNVSAVGFAGLMNNDYAAKWISFTPADEEAGAYLNVANITATYGDNTFILGRQLINTPMVTGYDWLLAESSFNAYTVVNTSFENITLVGSYLTQFRSLYDGDNQFADLAGDNFAFGASYSKDFDASAWYYNVDALDYTEVYIDGSKKMGDVTLSAQYVDSKSSSDATRDGSAFGVKVATTLGGFDLEAAYVDVKDGVGYAGDYDGLYTSMWMGIASAEAGSSYKVAASTDLAGISTTVAYAEYDRGSETNVILGYDFSDAISLGAIYSDSVDYDETVELIASYKF